jgi:hypothetical protein
MSSDSGRRAVPVSGTYRSTSRAARISGGLSRNTARHEVWSVSQPPAYGPTVVPSVASPAQIPMPRARSPGRSVPLSRARLLGTTSAAPAPWTTRAPISVPADGATAHAAEATSITSSPAASTRRRPK